MTFGDPPPLQPLSILDQVRLLKNGPHIRILIKVVAPMWPSSTIDPLVENMRLLFGSIGIGLVVKSIEELKLSRDFYVIDIGSCSENLFSTGVTDEQKELFRNDNGVEYAGDPEGRYAVDILIYLVQDTNPPANGCARSYPARRCAIISSRAKALLWKGGRWINSPRADGYTLAHEIGHILGLEHTEDNNRLMFSGRRINLPPDIADSEIKTIKSSWFMHKCP